jgi:hypothetical protein
MIPIDCFGTPGWTDYVVNLKKTAFDKIYDAAEDLIDASPWEIIGLPKHPKETSGKLTDPLNTTVSAGQPWFDSIMAFFQR